MNTTTLSRNNLAGVLASLSVDDMIWAMKFLADKLSSRIKEVTSSSKMSELDKAILDVEKGNVKSFDTAGYDGLFGGLTMKYRLQLSGRFKKSTCLAIQ